jgi:hypothetical protein
MVKCFLDFPGMSEIRSDLLMAKKKGKNPHAVYLGQLGGKARTQKLTAEERRAIARKAALARWEKRRTKPE